MRLKDLKLNTVRRKEIFLADFMDLLREEEFNRREVGLMASFLTMISEKWKTGLFRVELAPDSPGK